MRLPRCAGILLHPTSLPGAYGAGDLGPEAYCFLDFVASAGLKIWQVLPLGPTGYADSPYQSFSAFAGNPMLISLEILVAKGYLRASELTAPPGGNGVRVHFGALIPWKLNLLRLAARHFFAARGDRNAKFLAFQLKHRWLSDFARFHALKVANGMAAWTRWTTDRFDFEEAAAQTFWQFEFFEQWFALKRYANSRGIRVMGDLPIYLSGDSAEVWAHPGDYRLDVVAGVPPDYFSATGQLWGNPIYKWDLMARDGYRWWIERFRAIFEQVDLLRLDHFRGFYKYWQVPAAETTAMNGEWMPGPGAPLFRAVEAALGPLPVVAENLGVITPEVEAIRNEFSLPGMRILQFAFGNDPQGPSFRPHNYEHNTVAYTGTHDNDTTVGWWTSTAGAGSTRSEEDIRAERAFTLDYLRAGECSEIHWIFIQTVFASIADTAMVSAQDVLGLGNDARMNLPGSTSGNWVWRLLPGQLTPDHAARLRRMVLLYDR